MILTSLIVVIGLIGVLFLISALRSVRRRRVTVSQSGLVARLHHQAARDAIAHWR